MFKFVKRGMEYFWEDDVTRIKYSKPYIQGSDDYAFLKDEKGIMYYYYTTTLYMKNYKEEWKEMCNVVSYDFPCIFQLIDMLKMFIDGNIKDEDCQKIRYYDNKENENIGHKYVLETEGFLCDDFYQLERIKKRRGEEENINYNLYIGLSQRTDTYMSFGTRIEYLKIEDLKELLKCAIEFVKYSLDVHNEETRQANKEWTSSMKVIGNKLFRFENEKIRDMFIKNTKCSITRIIGDLDGYDFKSIEYVDCNLFDIQKDKIIINSGLYYNQHNPQVIEKNIEIPINEIVYISEDVPNERLCYGFNEIVQDWIAILDENERKEFVINNVDILNNKWNDAIIDRTWMCRQEHNYENFNEEDYRLEKVRKLARKVIIEVKNQLIAMSL